MQSIGSTIGQAANAMNPNITVDPRSVQSFMGNFPNFGGSIRNTNMGSMRPIEAYKANINTNYTISYEHTLVPWQDGSDFQISPGAYVFNQKHSNQMGEYVYSDCTLATVNSILQLAHDKFQALVANGNREATTFDQLLDDDRFEGKLDAARYLRDNGLVTQLSEEQAMGLRMMEKFIFRYITRVGILGSFNYLGVVLSRGDSTDNPAVYTNYMKARHVNNIVYSPRGEALAVNVFGGPSEVRVSAKLYFVLVKKKKALYQIEPFVSFDGKKPPTNDFWYVGLVRYRADSKAADGFVNKVVREGNPITAYQAVESVPRITVDLAI